MKNRYINTRPTVQDVADGKLQPGCFVKTSNGFPFGIVLRASNLKYGKQWLPAYIVDLGEREDVFLASDTVLVSTPDDVLDCRPIIAKERNG